MPVPSSIFRQQYAFFFSFKTFYSDLLNRFPLQADVSKVIEMRDGPEGLTKEEIDAKLLK